jgi:hypothetical protein
MSTRIGELERWSSFNQGVLINYQKYSHKNLDKIFDTLNSRITQLETQLALILRLQRLDVGSIMYNEIMKYLIDEKRNAEK